MKVVAVAKHGRFAPSTGKGSGDLDLALAAAEMWFGLGLEQTARDRFDGVDIWVRADGSTVVRLVAHDFFSGLRLICELDPETGKPY